MNIFTLFAIIFIFSLVWMRTRKYIEFITDEEAIELHDQIQEIHASRHITREQVLNPNTSFIPINLKDSLSKYDWVELGTYYFENNEFDDINEIADCYDFYRFGEKGEMHSFRSYHAPEIGEAFIGYKRKQTEAIPHRVVNRDGKIFLQYRNREGKTRYCHIINYQNGILTFDVTATGSLHDLDSTKRYRCVLMAIPQNFDYELKSRKRPLRDNSIIRLFSFA